MEYTMKFRTAQDDERTKRAAEVVATKQATFDAASAALAAAEEACATAPTDKAFAKAKDARRALEDAERDLTLARQHEGKVVSEVAAAEQAAIRTEIARRKSSVTEIVDDEAREAAVEIAALAVRLYQRTLARRAIRGAELEELNRLRTAIGERAEEIPSVATLTHYAVKELTEIGLAGQAQLGIRCRDIERPLTFFFPFWRAGEGSYDPKEFAPGVSVAFRNVEDGERLCASAAKLLERVEAELIERVEARRNGGSKSTSGIAAKAAAAAVGALGLLAAFTMVGG